MSSSSSSDRRSSKRKKSKSSSYTVFETPVSLFKNESNQFQVVPGSTMLYIRIGEGSLFYLDVEVKKKLIVSVNVTKKFRYQVQLNQNVIFGFFRDANKMPWAVSFEEESLADVFALNLAVALFILKKPKNGILLLDLQKPAGEEDAEAGDKVGIVYDVYSLTQPANIGDKIYESSKTFTYVLGEGPITGLDVAVEGMSKKMKRVAVMIPSHFASSSAPFSNFGEGHKAFLITLRGKKSGYGMTGSSTQSVEESTNKSEMIDKMKRLGASSNLPENNQITLAQPNQQGNNQNFNQNQQGNMNNQNINQNQNNIQQGNMNNQNYNQNQPFNQHGNMNNPNYQNQPFNQSMMPYGQQPMMQPPPFIIQQQPPQYIPPPSPAPQNNTKDVINMLVEEKSYKNDIISKLDVISTKMDKVSDRLFSYIPEKKTDANVNGISAKALLQTVKRIVVENGRLTSDTDAQSSRVNKLQAQVNDLLEKNRAIVEENNRYAQDRNSVYQNQSKEFKNQMSQLRDEKETLQIELSDAETKINTAKRKFETFKKKYTRLSEEYKSNLSLLEYETENRQKHQNLADEAIEELNTAKTNYLLTQREYEQLQQDYSQSQKDLSMYLHRCEKLRDQLEENTNRSRQELSSRENHFKEEKLLFESRIETLTQTVQNERVVKEEEKQRLEADFLQKEKINNESIRALMKKQFELQLDDVKNKWEEQKERELENLRMEYDLALKRKEQELNEHWTTVSNDHFERGKREVGDENEEIVFLKDREIEKLNTIITGQNEIIEKASSNSHSTDAVKKVVTKSIDRAFKNLSNIFIAETPYSGEEILTNLKTELVSAAVKEIKIFENETDSTEDSSATLDYEMQAARSSADEPAGVSSEKSQEIVTEPIANSSTSNQSNKEGHSESNQVEGKNSSKVSESDEITSKNSKSHSEESDSDNQGRVTTSSLNLEKSHSTKSASKSKSETKSLKSGSSSDSLAVDEDDEAAQITPVTDPVTKFDSLSSLSDDGEEIREPAEEAPKEMNIEISQPTLPKYSSLSSLSSSSEESIIRPNTQVTRLPGPSFDIFGAIEKPEFDVTKAPAPSDFPFSDSSLSDEYEFGNEFKSDNLLNAKQKSISNSKSARSSSSLDEVITDTPVSSIPEKESFSDEKFRSKSKSAKSSASSVDAVLPPTDTFEQNGEEIHQLEPFADVEPIQNIVSNEKSLSSSSEKVKSKNKSKSSGSSEPELVTENTIVTDANEEIGKAISSEEVEKSKSISESSEKPKNDIIINEEAEKPKTGSSSSSINFESESEKDTPTNAEVPDSSSESESGFPIETPPVRTGESMWSDEDSNISEKDIFLDLTPTNITQQAIFGTDLTQSELDFSDEEPEHTAPIEPFSSDDDESNVVLFSEVFKAKSSSSSDQLIVEKSKSNSSDSEKFVNDIDVSEVKDAKSKSKSKSSSSSENILEQTVVTAEIPENYTPANIITKEVPETTIDNSEAGIIDPELEIMTQQETENTEEIPETVINPEVEIVTPSETETKDLPDIPATENIISSNSFDNEDTLTEAVKSSSSEEFVDPDTNEVKEDEKKSNSSNSSEVLRQPLKLSSSIDNLEPSSLSDEFPGNTTTSVVDIHQSIDAEGDLSSLSGSDDAPQPEQTSTPLTFGGDFSSLSSSEEDFKAPVTPKTVPPPTSSPVVELFGSTSQPEEIDFFEAPPSKLNFDDSDDDSDDIFADF